METQCQNEIIDLHRFFVAWFKGDLPSTDESFTRLANVLHPDMTLILPDGHLQTRDQLLPLLRQAHGSRRNSPFRIWIKNFRLHYHVGSIVLVTYEEWQETEDKITTRLSTALFQEKKGTPNNVEWLHVHETWLKP